MNSKVNTAFLNIVSATMNKNVDDIRATPFIAPEDKIQVVDMLVKNCIKISREDWDSFELSWDFKKHPASTGERVKLNKKLITLQAQDTEIRIYEEKIHHLADQMISIDLDDGVKKNYAIFQDVLAKIK